MIFFSYTNLSTIALIQYPIIPSTKKKKTLNSATIIKVAIVENMKSEKGGHCILRNSPYTSSKKITNRFIIHSHLDLFSYTIFNLLGRPGGIRTPNHQIWSLLLYR
jgi:hypothetical protein